MGYRRCGNVSSRAGGLFSWVIHLPAIVFLGDTVARRCLLLGYRRCRNVSSRAGGLFSWVIHLPAIVFLGDTVARRCFLGL